MAWFSKSEIEAMLPDLLKPRAAVDLSKLAHRLARFHLVDNVRGQTLPYAASEIMKASLKGEAIAKVGDTIVLAFTGETLARANGPWLMGDNLWKPRAEKRYPHGIETKLMGRANVNVKTHEVTDFELLAVGRRWGKTIMNGRGKNAEPGRLVFHFQLDRSGRRLAPTFIAVYDADWVRHPEIPTWLESPAECGLTDD